MKSILLTIIILFFTANAESRFLGKEELTNHISYFDSRYYSHTLGRFLTQDIAKAIVSEYGYVNGNPIMESDPTGLMPVLGLDELEVKVVELSARSKVENVKLVKSSDKIPKVDHAKSHNKLIPETNDYRPPDDYLHLYDGSMDISHRRDSEVRLRKERMSATHSESKRMYEQYKIRSTDFRKFEFSMKQAYVENPLMFGVDDNNRIFQEKQNLDKYGIAIKYEEYFNRRYLRKNVSPVEYFENHGMPARGTKIKEPTWIETIFKKL